MPSTRSPGAVDSSPATMPSARSRARSARRSAVGAAEDSGFSAVAEAGEVEVAAVNTDAAVLSASTAAAIVRRKISLSFPTRRRLPGIVARPAAGT